MVKSQADLEEGSARPAGPSLPARLTPVRPATGAAGGLWPALAAQRGTIVRRRLVALLLHATPARSAAMTAIDRPEPDRVVPANDARAELGPRRNRLQNPILPTDLSEEDVVGQVGRPRRLAAGDSPRTP
jgi:hypothetical protein